MATQIIHANNMFTIDVTVRESDEYTKAVYLKFEHNYHPDKIRGCSEMFMTPAQLDLMGRFLIRQAEEIRIAQLNSDSVNER